VLPWGMLCTCCTDPLSKHQLQSSGVRVHKVMSRVSDIISPLSDASYYES
jgi:hypothetical protein